MKIIGLDVGGANLKACGLEINDSKAITDINCRSIFFPIWQQEREELWRIIVNTVYEVSDGVIPDLISVVMTAELSDTFQTKREGVLTIARNIVETLEKIPIVFPSVELDLFELSQVEDNPHSVAAANWAPLAWAVGRTYSDCLLIDVGSTTTDVIPVRNGFPHTSGLDDTSRLIHGELVYTGALRTDLSAILQRVKTKQGTCRVSSEYFATSADVHLILGNIDENVYSSDTADNRGKSEDECRARIARLICSDIELVPRDEISDIAKQVWNSQINEISEAILQVCDKLESSPEDVEYVISGLGSEFLARPAIQKIGGSKISDLKEAIGIPGSVAATAYAAALLTLSSWRSQN
jgi:probable H4MPT-linked C1 transfer pathway protein